LADIRVATQAADRPADYIREVAEGSAPREPLTPEEAAEERLLGGLRIAEGVAFGEVAALGLTPDDPRVRGLVELGLLAPGQERLAATPAGRRLLDSVTAELALPAASAR
jgi:oxygen-independent coproporphyrinogen-3 oxidase